MDITFPEKRSCAHPLHAWARVRLNLFMAYRGASLARDPQFIRRNDRYTLWRVNAGCIQGSVDGARFKTRPDRWCVPAIGELSAQISPGTRLHSVHFELTWSDGRPLVPWPRTEHFEDDPAKRFDAAASALIQTVETHAPGAGYRLPVHAVHGPGALLIQARAWELAAAFVECAAAFGHVPQPEQASDARLARALAVSSSGLGADRTAAARAAGVSPRHLDRLCQAAYGHPFHSQVDRELARRAAEHLLRSSGDCKGVAFDLGFRSLSHFSHWFRRHHGTSPREFARRGLP